MEAKSKQNEQPSAHDLAVVLTADICQLTVDAKTHPDADARERILVRVRRLENIIMGRMTPDLKVMIQRAGELLRQETA